MQGGQSARLSALAVFMKSAKDLMDENKKQVADFYVSNLFLSCLYCIDVLDRQFVQNIDKFFIDRFIHFDSLVERNIYNLVIVNTYHNVSLFFLQCFNCSNSQTACQYTVECAWSTSTLQVSEDGYTYVIFRIFLANTVCIVHALVVENGKTVEIDLNGHTITNETDVWAGNDWSLFSVRGGTLTIKNGTVKAKDNDCYACDVQYGGTLIIEDGTFVGNISAVYVHEGKAEIKGGTFSIVQTETEGDPYRFLLNCYDSNRQAGKASIVVTGGTFENFNPADNAAEGAGTNFVDEGYKAVKIAETPAPNGTFQVVKNAKVDNADELIGALADPEIANIEVASDIDLAAKSSEELTFEEHKTIDIKEGVTLQLGSANFLTAEKGLTLTGKGTLDNSAAASTAVVAAASDVHEHKSLIHVTGGDLLIDGVTLINDPEYHWHGSSYNTAAIAYWNDANVTIRNARVISGEFTLCGMGRNGANTATVTLIDSFFESTSSNLDNKQHWAYAMRLFGSEVLIENCEVKGIQGAVSIEENAKAEIRSGKFYTVNTSGQQDAFYALYVSSSAEVTITGGEFSAPNVRTGLQIEGTSAVVSGDNDTGRPSGSVILKGGKFSGKAYNHVTNTVYAPAAGYQWQAITDGDNLKWAVVPATR